VQISPPPTHTRIHLKPQGSRGSAPSQLNIIPQLNRNRSHERGGHIPEFLENRSSGEFESIALVEHVYGEYPGRLNPVLLSLL
jgi:hypothetical protein